MALQIKQYPASSANYGNARAASAIKYIVIHYTGNDGDTAMNNAKYYAQNDIKTSAHYFVDSKEIIQSVADLRVAWAVGGSKYASCAQTGGGKLYGKCKNANSISIEICDEQKNGTYYPKSGAITNALKLAKQLMEKYNIPQENVVRHFDVTGKLCPAYWAGKENESKWKSAFWDKLLEPDYTEMLKKRAGLLDSTMNYLEAYAYGEDLVRKLATMK